MVMRTTMGFFFVFVVSPFFWLAVSVVVAFQQPACSLHQHPLQKMRRRRPTTAIKADDAVAVSAFEDDDEMVVDVVVIGAGIGGLCCAAVSALYGHEVLCVEAHDTPGGVAHSFRRRSSSSGGGAFFEFDSGPSLLSGMSSKGSTNPLRQVLDALDVADLVKWQQYDGWVIHDTSSSKSKTSASSSSATKDKSSSFKLTTGTGGAWEQAVEDYAGLSARREFETLRDQLLRTGGLSEA
jgi:hypothetical protein